LRSWDTEDKTESSDEEFPVTDEKESACKVPSLVFNTTDKQTKILNDIIINKSHRDDKDYKYCGSKVVLWGGMKRLLNEGPLPTTNNTSKNV
jgi:hypothetical protein